MMAAHREGRRPPRRALAVGLVGCCLGFVGCAVLKGALDQVVEAPIGDSSLRESARLVQKGVEVGGEIAKAAENFTPEQEYFIGRAVAAQLIDRYGVFDDAEATRYVNLVGAAIVACVDVPEPFSGYHFVILDSDEINAFAAPGAFILVTRGLLRCCQREDEVAAVIAHELAHVKYGHAIRTIRSARWTQTMALIGEEAARQAGDRDLQKLTEAFDGVLEDILETLVVKGYSRSQEKEADIEAVGILRTAGYGSVAMVDLLERMARIMDPEGFGFAKTHPPPQARIDTIRPIVGSSSPLDPPERSARFEEQLSRARQAR